MTIRPPAVYRRKEEIAGRRKKFSSEPAHYWRQHSEVSMMMAEVPISRTQKPFSALWKVTRSLRPASTSWVDGSGLDFIRIVGSSVLSLGATPVEPPRRRIIGAGQRADDARCRAKTYAIDGRN